MTGLTIRHQLARFNINHFLSLITIDHCYMATTLQQQQVLRHFHSNH